MDTPLEILRRFLRDAGLWRGETLSVKVHNGVFDLPVDVLVDLIDELERLKK